MTVTPIIVYFYCLAKHATSQVLQAKTVSKHYTCLGNGSSGVVVLEGDTCSEGHGFESLHHTLDGHFYR